MSLIASFANSQSREKLTKIHWDYDIEKTKIGIKAQKVWKRTFEELKEVSMVGSIQSKQMRDEMRQRYENDNVKLLLTDNDCKELDASEEDSDTVSSDGDLEVEVSDSESDN